jgi:hypothetical protein
MPRWSGRTALSSGLAACISFAGAAACFASPAEERVVGILDRVCSQHAGSSGEVIAAAEREGFARLPAPFEAAAMSLAELDDAAVRVRRDGETVLAVIVGSSRGSLMCVIRTQGGPPTPGLVQAVQGWLGAPVTRATRATYDVVEGPDGRRSAMAELPQAEQLRAFRDGRMRQVGVRNNPSGVYYSVVRPSASGRD